MHRVALLIGGNQGDRRLLIQQATEQIRQRIGSVVALSRVYETEPWGEFEVSRVQDFLNQGLLVETPLSAHDVLREALAIEADLGRVRPGGVHTPPPALRAARKYHSRPIDIDLIFFDHDVIDTPDLTIPHPRMHLRRFVLEPLAEIMPDYVHPLLNNTVVGLLAQLDAADKPRRGVGIQAGVSTPAHDINNESGTPMGVEGPFNSFTDYAQLTCQERYPLGVPCQT
ncbi:MAG: 2-amino-4-hydroxy-6-hydroxymethyldihydropteridine diphosphokinase [Bacteroidales bacterium]|nr:2-amino-4-hydroxy-6-hydroxymethyldihydropteridine diphosphokinase [Bacteroidales bacterium]